MESVKKARARLSAYPKYLAACSAQGTAYAKCVANHMGEVGKKTMPARVRGLQIVRAKTSQIGRPQTLTKSFRGTIF